jgi:orotate phosphoribosyltransferase
MPRTINPSSGAPVESYPSEPADGYLHRRLAAALREHALEIGDVKLSSGEWAKYYVDAKRLALSQPGFDLIAELVALEARRVAATAVGGLSLGADAIACSALSAGVVEKAFFVRKERKEHGLQRWIEGPTLEPDDRLLIVDDIVTRGGSTVEAIEKVRDANLRIVGVMSVLDRLAGGRKAIEGATDAPYIALTTIDDVYPERPDR